MEPPGPGAGSRHHRLLTNRESTRKPGAAGLLGFAPHVLLFSCPRMAAAEAQGGGPCGFTRQNSGNSLSLDFEPEAEYRFVELLEERYKCTRCRAVLHNPHQTGCGHRFCQRCILALRELNTVALCPVDKEVIKSQEVFRDNCCRREVLNLYVYCKNAPGCSAKTTLGRYQEHLQQCPFQAVLCPNDGCREPVLRRALQEHLSAHCPYREERCRYCKRDVPVIALQGHEENLCPEYPVSCPNKCLQTIPRTEVPGDRPLHMVYAARQPPEAAQESRLQVDQHLAVCPEAEQDCPFRHYGCAAKAKRGSLREHEHTALRDHMLLVLEKNVQLEEQISDLYKSLEQKESKIQQLEETVQKFAKDFEQLTQLFGRNGSFVSSMQVLASHVDRSAWLEAQVHQLLQTVSQQQTKLDLRPLADAVDAVKRRVTLLETSDRRLGTPNLGPSSGNPWPGGGSSRTGPAAAQPGVREKGPRGPRGPKRRWLRGGGGQEPQVVWWLSRGAASGERGGRGTRASAHLAASGHGRPPSLSLAVALEGETHKHDARINSHGTQLDKNEERFRQLEGACHSGKLVWKVTGYRAKKQEAVDGHTVSVFSQPFYTSRCGYRLCARAYLNGDGAGKGSHLSLYFVVMRGEFDALLQWPFRQRVTLMLLDQSGKKNHIMETFKADPNSSSFKRPDGEMNIASGCPRFVAHSTLESSKNVYIKEDTLFLKVAVDLSDLEDL
ncbi:TNF receptor-associated factor 5 [Galemys pyrenaicus]|uniref:TNF receptor-associated factor 5 n=1 Tax=Galemys pyrenaicus TaxID=202257 RepID=A0A8J6DAW9_GALPY|nr:TNF receptor-associated factor 5 [Galemys pyrenaicus]